MKGKIIIAFIIGCIAFFLAWTVSKVTFRKMLVTIEDISAPNKKLRMVNDLYRDITSLNQVERSKALFKKENSFTFSTRSVKLRQTLDSLAGLYKNEPVQLKRIDSMKKILLERDSLFVNYLRVREGLVKGSIFTDQLGSLSGLISKSSRQIDSTVVTTEQRKSTTTVVPNNQDGKQDKGFLKRIFGKKESEKNAEPQKVVKEEVNIKIDTLAKANQEAVIAAMKEAVNNLQRKQHQQSVSFVNRETDLANAGNILTNQILAILQQVEKEVINQEDIRNQQARHVVNTSIERISYIMLVFLIVTAALVYLILIDISRSNAYRQELELARTEAEYHSMAKQRFLSSMSHEIRTPLQSIIGYAELIKDQNNPDKKAINAIYHSSNHLLQIVNEVLDYSRIISGKFRFEKHLFSVSQLLAEVTSVMRPQAEKKSLQLELLMNLNDADFVEGDSFRLKQILYNLTGNAIKFTQTGKVTIKVTGKKCGKAARFTFSVMDSGPGIAAEDLKRIFTEFEQAYPQSANTNGTGLGLSIVKALTEEQGGTVHAESEPGKGSCFTVELQFRIKALPEPSIPKETSSFSFKGKVWIVDDDQFILQLMDSLFTKYNIPHVCFSSPAEVLEMSADDQLSIIFLDMRLPEISGAGLCKILRKRLPENIKIYALTAQALPEERDLILQQCFDGLLMKPFREQEILNLLNKNPVSPEGSVPEPRVDFDISVIEKMTLGDQSQLKKILNTFVEDTENDILHLQSAFDAGQADTLALIFHRLAGRTAQIGAGKLAAQLRKEEIFLHENKKIEKNHENKIIDCIRDLRSLINQIKKKSITSDYSI